VERRLAVLASGTGSNFAALADAAAEGRLRSARIVGLIYDRWAAGVRQKAEDRGIPAVYLGKKNHPAPEDFEAAVIAQLEAWQAEWICLAGFLRILSPAFVGRFRDRIVNVHPSLLPAFPGLNAARQALEAGVRETGCTVHLVTERLDAGPIVRQERVPILPGDSEATLLERLHPVEHRAYVAAMRDLLERPFRVRDNRIEWL
jgi:phosphoribosylglycinamide formyltransferase-1